MDPTTLLTAVLIAVGLLGADAVVYSGSVIVDVAPPPKIESISVDKATLAAQFEDKLNDIVRTSSVVRPVEIRPSSEQGLGMALAEAAGVQSVATALEGSIGYNPDRLRFALYTDGDQLRGLVSGSSHLSTTFQNVMTPSKGEPLLTFVQRCALWGASQLAPYSTTLYLLEQHASDQDFTDVVALSEHSKALLPATPRSFDRALFDNVLGLVALFKNDKQGARDAFDRAMRSDPTNPVPFLNAAFTDLEFDENQRAADRMSQLIRLAPPENKELLATAYFTWGAALMGLKDIKGANQMLAAAVKTNPHSATALHLWSEAKELEGDKAASERLAQKAMEQTATFENYAEVAALYFHLSWDNNAPVTRSQFANPGVVTFH
jgi:tetratricopeptide (TPR) repeat protein